MAKFIYDDAVWDKACFDTPLRSLEHMRAKTAEEAVYMPGNAVKSLGSERSGFPKYLGVLVKYGEECVVRGHNSPVSGRFVWRGTKQDYNNVWTVD